MNEKMCKYCKVIKPFNEFNKSTSRRDGHQKNCKECNKYLNRKYKEKKAIEEGRVMKAYEPKNFATISSEELLQILRDFYDEYKRPPLTSDFENNSRYPHFKTYYRHFKYYTYRASSWDNILELAGISPLNKVDLWSAWQYIVERAATLLEGEPLFQYCGFSKDFKPDIYIPSKNKIIDAATSDYKDRHKLFQYKKGIIYVDTVEYWCLNKNNTEAFDLPNLKYVYADEIIERLSEIGHTELCDDILNLYSKYTTLAKNYKIHKQEYIIKKLQDFYKENGISPKHRDLIANSAYPSATTVRTVFGTFNNALLASGLEINRYNSPKIKVDN